MEESTFETLELDGLLELLSRHVQTPTGRKQALHLRPSTDTAAIQSAQDRTTECRDYIETMGALGLSGLEDPSDILSQLQIQDSRLDALQILTLERLLAVALDLRASLLKPEIRERYPKLSGIASAVPDLRRLLHFFKGKILPNGEIDDHASPSLRRIRREIIVSRSRIHKSLETLMRSQSRAVQEELVTFRNGRFVIPLRTDARGEIPGVMHGLSSSGQTSYIEPLTVIEQNNDLVRLRESEEQEIAAILQSITEALRESLPGIRECLAAVTEMDLAQAKARLSAEFDCIRPRISEGRRLRLLNARNILLEHALRQTGGRPVPVSFEMDEEHRVMVISGPNAGGKTVVLKTTGLAALMAQAGLHVPATEAVLPVYRQIFADIGDQQSMAENLSTFTAHLKNISVMASALSPPALLLIDEVGTGTDPDEGSALAVAILEYFLHAGASMIASTHYTRLKMWAAQTAGVLNASVEFDTLTLQPTYRLIVGIAGASAGLQIARRMDLPLPMLETAQARLEPAQVEAADYLRRIKSLADEQERLRSSLEAERHALAERLECLEREFGQKEEKRRVEFDAALAEVLRGISAEGRRLLDSIQQAGSAARLRKKLDAQISGLKRAGESGMRQKALSLEQTEAPVPSDESLQVPGKSDASGAGGRIGERDRVLIKSLHTEGIVESSDDKSLVVRVGSLRFRTTLDDLHLLERGGGDAAGLTRGVSLVTNPDREFTGELKVIGMTADDATDRVEKFLDEAYLADVESVRIVHGHGKGILRKAISSLLSHHPLVESFGPAPPDKGGSGATIAVLKKD